MRNLEAYSRQASFMLASYALLVVSFILVSPFNVAAEEVLNKWLQPQDWRRDTEGPILSLGSPGDFDDTHIFAPFVTRNADEYQLYYCGSRGAVSQRVFRLGLARGKDGRVFQRVANNPIYGFADGKRSVLTPHVLRKPDGRVIREQGKLRMWFSATDFRGDGLHTLHESTSSDGVLWSAPSAAQLKNVYAPTVVRSGNEYQMWYVDVEKSPWTIRRAIRREGRDWQADAKPCLVVDQAWERDRLFYPTVLKIEDAYLMWYGSYWRGHANSTATGFAVSLDGVTWHKHPSNPVLRPSSDRPWESHYVTSQSVIRFDDGSFRIWYASRKQPPFRNKYFALNTARWRPGHSEAEKRDGENRDGENRDAENKDAERERSTGSE